MTEIAFESHGVRVAIATDVREVAERIPELLPPDAVPVAMDSVEETFGVETDASGGTYTYTRKGSPVSSDLDLEFALTLLQTQVRIFIGLYAPNRLFVHAGVVAIDGRAIVLPGRSFAGKTTLVAEFLRQGATYLSDEFAVFDDEGLVHPYLSKLSVRETEEHRRAVDPSEMGSSGVTDAIPVAAIVFTNYEPGAEWHPQEMSQGRAALGLLDNTLAALERQGAMLPLLRRVTDGPLRLAGPRGEAAPVVADLMARLS